MDITFLLGPVDPHLNPSLEEMAQELKTMLGFSLEPVAEKEMFQGGSASGHAWLTEDPEENEPFLSHPFNLDVATNEDELAYANGIFDILAQSGRLRAVLLVDSACVRSTHFPCANW